MGLLDVLIRSIPRRRAQRYVKAYPKDVFVVQATLAAFELNAKSAREAAEMAMGHEIDGQDWQRVSKSWERV